jgi:hypothetical protein
MNFRKYMKKFAVHPSEQNEINKRYMEMVDNTKETTILLKNS